MEGTRSGVARRLVRATTVLVLLGAGIDPALGQDDPHAACAAPPSYVPAELLERAIPLRSGSGIGNSHEAVTTASAEAQAFYDQGLNYLESYVWIEAARSFHQALRLDAGLALAHIGLSRVHSGLDDVEGAKRFFEKAQVLAPGVSERERRRIEIREKQLAALDDIGDASRFLAYKKAIDDALAKDFEDPQLWLLRGNAEEPNASGRGQRGGAASIAFYATVLRLVPDHASAHHYLVHSYETLNRIDEALEHGAAYARLAPSIPHAAHMWGHDLRRVGRVDEAIVQFLKADALERAYYAAERIDPALDWHHAHNLDILASCYEHKGQMQLAERTMRESAALGVVDAYRAFNLRELPSFLIHRARYQEALEAGRALSTTSYAQSRTVGHALAGQALLGLGRVEAAQDELEAARRELEAVPLSTIGLVPRRSAVEPWVEALRGELLLRAGPRDEGRAVLKEVVRALRATPGPDAWTQTLFRLEALARSAREVGDWELAEFLAAQMLDHDSNYGGSHHALALVLRHAGDVAGFNRESAAARRLWHDADPDLAELQESRTENARERTGPALVLLVRHAEKAAEPVDDPSLTPAGRERAQALAAALHDAGVTAILTTQLRRTRETAEPLAVALGLTPEVVPVERGQAAANAAAVAAAVGRHAGGVVLVIGHNNTVSLIITALGGPALPDICESAYSNLFVLVPGAGAAHLARSRYGATDPEPGPNCR